MAATNYRDTEVEDPDVLDLTDTDPNATMSPIPPGEYEAICTAADYGPSKAGKPMITLTFKLEGNDDADVDGRTCKTYLVLSDDLGKARTKKSLMILKPEFEDWANFRPANAANLFEGGRCRLKTNIQAMKDNKEIKMTQVQDILPSNLGGGFFTG